MKPIDMEAFSALLTDVLAYYGKDNTKFTTDIWWQAMQSFDLQQVGKALQKHATDPERGQFAPKVADIVKALQGTHGDRAAIAWGKAFDAMSSVGAYRDVVFDDPAIHAAIQDIGGWAKVCRTETEELSYLQHRFTQSYKAYAERGVFDYPKRLNGDRSSDDEYRKIGIQPPKPAVIGNVEQARLVYRGGGTGAAKVSYAALDAIPSVLKLSNQGS